MKPYAIRSVNGIGRVYMCGSTLVSDPEAAPWPPGTIYMDDVNNTVPGSSMVERGTVNTGDAGSSPALAARKPLEVTIKVTLAGISEARKELDELEARALGLEKRIGKITDTVVLGK